jgi:hypothetical protein
VPVQATGRIFAKDIKTGRTIWSDERDVFGTTMAYNGELDILIMSFNNVGRSLPSDSGGSGARAYKGATGGRLWENPGAKVGRSVMIGETLWDYDAINILTGRQREVDGASWRMKGKGIGCGVWVGGENILLRRSGTVGYYDLERDTGWVDNYGGVRSGCWINTLPVGGIVLMPDDTQGCRCSYQNVANVAFIDRGVYRPEIRPIKGQKNFKQRTSVGREVVFTGSLDIEISGDYDGAEIRYSLDGGFASEESPVYSKPITINDTSHIAAAVFKGGEKLSVRDPVIFLKLSKEDFDNFEKAGAMAIKITEAEAEEKLLQRGEQGRDFKEEERKRQRLTEKNKQQ